MFGWQERPLEKAGQLEARFGAVLGDFEAVWTSVPFKALRWSPALMGVPVGLTWPLWSHELAGLPGGCAWVDRAPVQLMGTGRLW